jgi:IS30 family transposase
MKRHWADSSLKCNTLPNRSGVKMTTRYRPLQPENRVTLASLLQQGHSLRSIAKVLERSPSSVSREVARNRSAEGADRIVQAMRLPLATLRVQATPPTPWMRSTGVAAAIR